MVRARIIKTTKYAHVKDGEVADSIAVEHNVLATYFPTLFHRRRTESDRTADGNRLDGERKPIGRRTRTMAHLGGALVSSAPTEQEMHQPSKSCINRARNAPTEQELHQPSKKCTNRARAAPSASPISSNILPQNTQNSQNLLLSILPQISRKYTDC
jgi:hypothetical protein